MGHISQRSAWVRHQAGTIGGAAQQLPRLIAEERPRASPRIASVPLAPEARDVLIAIEQDALARIAEAEARADAAIADAQMETEQWRAYALAAEEDARQQGYAAGYAEAQQRGYEAGEAAAQAAMQGDLTHVANLAASCVSEMRQALQATQVDLAALSLEIARAVIGEALQVDPELTSRRVAKLLEALSERATATVRVNPADLALVQARWPVALRSRRATDQGPRLLADAAIAPGGCTIDARSQYLEGQWDVLLEEVGVAFARVPMSERSDEDQLGAVAA